MIANQVKVLNNAFAKGNVQFTLAQTTRTINPDWFDNVAPDSDQNKAMKLALRKGTAKDLNVYSVGCVPFN